MASLSTALVAMSALFCVYGNVCAAPASHPISERDSDLDSEIKDKLQKIRDLLDKMQPSEAESDLQKVANAKSRHEGEMEAQEKDMRSLSSDKNDLDSGVLVPRLPHHKMAVPEPPQPEATEDDSIMMLAHALARLQQPQLQQPQAVMGDIDGELMGSRYNEEIENTEDEESQVTKDFEESLRRALARLQNEDDGESEGSPRVVEPPAPSRYHEEAIRLVESRLVRDMAIANKLGLSVEDLIQDLEKEEVREETLRRLDNSLASLALGRDE